MDLIIALAMANLFSYTLQALSSYPVRACVARGYVSGRGVYMYIVYTFLEPIFYLPKYSLSVVYFYTDRLLIEFNGLWYSLAARQVFVAIANPVSLSFG